MSRKSHTERDAEFEICRIPFDGPGPLPGKELVGSKAHNLMRMARRGLPVPPGFVLGTGLCRAYMARGAKALAGVGRVLEGELAHLATVTGRSLGDPKRPLLVSVRSGAPVSMPGMMETILNIGLSETTLRGLIRLTGNPRLAFDCERRLIQQFAEVVHGCKADTFEKLLDGKLADCGAESARDLDSQSLRELAAQYTQAFEDMTDEAFPASPLTQLEAAVEAVLQSWQSDRAQAYRKMNDISADIGTATIVQLMVFGNAGPASGSGVGFSRNPSDGTKALFVDFLSNAQGEDVVSGRTNALGAGELERRTPEAYAELVAAAETLEQEFGDMQDFEFTVENGKLYMLQARSGKRTPLAALRIATDLVEEGRIEPTQALALLKGLDLDEIECVGLVSADGAQPLASGVPASAGVATGAAVFDPARVAAFKEKGKPIILMRDQTETSDIKALADAEALVTAHGARTSHAAVVARQLGKTCLVGCRTLAIDPDLRRASFGAEEIREGDTVTVDGTAGIVLRGAVPVTRTKPQDLIDVVRSWSHVPAHTSEKAHARSRRTASKQR